MSDEMHRVLEIADNDDSVRSVVITGAGKSFCSGLDLGPGPGGADAVKDFYGGDGHDEANKKKKEEVEAGDHHHLLPHMLKKPVIAAINGSALGIGLSYPMLADVRIVAEDAKLAFLFTKRGLVPELGAHLVVTRVCGMSNAADLLMSGRVFDGKEAARIGLASVAVPADQVLAVAMEKARTYADAAPASVAFVKKLVWAAATTPMTWSEVSKTEDDIFAWVGKKPDFPEGIASFVERRKPAWKVSLNNDLPADLLDPLGTKAKSTTATSKL